MKFKTLTLVLIIGLITFTSCNENNNELTNTKSTIEIGNYLFEFPSDFKLIERQGIDSYVGNIVGKEVSFSFDLGWYTSASKNLPLDEYLVIEDEVNGHFRQIVKAINPKLNYTKIHLYKISDSLASPFGYNSLTVSTNNLTVEQQEMVIDVFNSVSIDEK